MNFHIGDSRRNVLHKLIFILCMETPSWYPSQRPQEDFQTDPLIHPSFLEITPINFTYCECNPHAIAAESMNILVTNCAEVHHRLYLQ